MVKDWEGTAVYYGYDKRGLITTVHSPAGWTYYEFDARGAATKRHLPNGTCTYYAYDPAGRVSSIADRKSDGTAITSFEFTRDANGNILTSLREDDSCWYYQYDGLQRLTDAEWKASDGASLYAFAYDYDRVGNRVSLVLNGEVTYYSYNEANELTEEFTVGGDSVYYAYDGRGNQIERSVLGGETTYFAYNSRNLLAGITSTELGFTPNTFEYNALSERIKKVDSTGTTYYVWDGLNITHEHDGSGTLTRRYAHGHTPIHGVFSLLDVQYFDYDTNPHYFYHLDQVGGVHRLTDTYENVIQTLEFSPYGRMLEETGSAPSELAFPGNHAKLADLATVRVGPSRTYDSGTARWFSRPAERSEHPYLYVAANPAGEVDPSGMPDPIGAKLAGLLYTRCLTGGAVFGVVNRLFRRGRYVFFDERDEMRTWLTPEMDRFFRYYVQDLKRRRQLTAKYKEFKLEGVNAVRFVKRWIPAKDSWRLKLEPGLGIYSWEGLARFLLNESTCVTVSGTIEAKCVGPTVFFRVVDTEWSWYDDIDARSILELEWRTANPLEALVRAAEAWFDLWYDKLLNAWYPVEIMWHHSSPDEHRMG
jgi:RHS repeat-associated protein